MPTGQPKVQPTPKKSRPFDSLGHETPREDLDALAELVQRYVRSGGVVVEVGTWAGATALALSDELDEESRLFCVDHWRGNKGDDHVAELAKTISPERAYATFCRNMGNRLMRQVIPLIGTSAFHAQHWPQDVPIDLLFIDGDHRYGSVKADISAWTSHVAVGGIVAGHDYGIFPGVTRAVDEFFPSRTLAGRCVWWAEKEEF